MIQEEPRFFTNLLKVAMLTAVMSFFFFPIGFRGLPESLNTKQMLGVVGILIFSSRSIAQNAMKLPRQIAVSALMSFVFSLWCFFSTTENGLSDYAYATYFLSFFVWLGGAYAVCELLRHSYGKVDIHLVTRYLTYVCLAQCVFVFLVKFVPPFQYFVDTFIIQDNTAKNLGRLYGIGCSLDSGGVRFCMTELLIAHEICTNKVVEKKKGLLAFYILSEFLLLCIGCMIARTAMIGFLLGTVYTLITFGYLRNGEINIKQRRFIRFSIIFIAILTAVGIYFYNHDAWMHKQIRFAFEAFFNFAEHGELRTGSSDKLMTDMWIWPWDDKGWAIGYGLFEWKYWKAYGIQTDIGYCRFTLYCGLIGLAIFSLFFLYNAFCVSRKFKKAKLLAALFAALTFIIWIKVSTDIFQIYALLFCLPAEFDEDGDEIKDEDSEEDTDVSSDDE